MKLSVEPANSALNGSLFWRKLTQTAKKISCRKAALISNQTPAQLKKVQSRISELKIKRL